MSPTLMANVYRHVIWQDFRHDLIRVLPDVDPIAKKGDFHFAPTCFARSAMLVVWKGKKRWVISSLLQISLTNATVSVFVLTLARRCLRTHRSISAELRHQGLRSWPIRMPTVTDTSSPMSGNSAKHLLLGEIFLYLSKFLNLAPWQSYSITTDSRVDQPTDGKTRKPVISADLSSLVQLNIRTSRLKLNTRVAFWARKYEWHPFY